MSWPPTAGGQWRPTVFLLLLLPLFATTSVAAEASRRPPCGPSAAAPSSRGGSQPHHLAEDTGGRKREAEVRACTDKKEKKIFLIYKEIQREQLQSIYDWRHLYIWGNNCAFPHILGSLFSYCIWLCNCSTLNFLMYEENFICFFSVWKKPAIILFALAILMCKITSPLQKICYFAKMLIFRERKTEAAKNSTTQEQVFFSIGNAFLFDNYCKYSNMLGFYIHLQAQLCKNVTHYSIANFQTSRIKNKKIRSQFYPRTWIWSSRVVRAYGCQCRSCNNPGFVHSILRHIIIWGAADKQCWITYNKKKESKNSPIKFYPL